MFIATEDSLCPYQTALNYIPLIQSETNIVEVPGVDHDYFGTVANSDWFIENLTAQLMIPDDDRATEPTTSIQ